MCIVCFCFFVIFASFVTMRQIEMFWQPIFTLLFICFLYICIVKIKSN